MSKQRNIEIAVNGALPIDGYKAVLQRVGEFEKRIAEGETLTAIDSVAGNASLQMVLTSLSAYETYVVDLSDFDPVLGNYVFDLVEIGPA